jgi:pre-mRNA-processing factor 40
LRTDGRSYFFNSRLNQTTWEKPDVLKTPAEIRLEKIPWKEYKTPDGRTYWNNSQTGQSVWSMPDEYKDALEGPAKPANGYNVLQFPSNRSSTSMALTLQTFIPAQREQEEAENTPGTEAYHNKEEAKKDFVRLLRKTEIEPTSEWNDVLPLIIKNPAFRAVPNPVERKQLFDNFLETLRTEVDEKEKDRRHRVREAFLAMCRRHPEIHHYNRFKTAKPILQEETDWKAAKDDDERRELFEEFRKEALQTVVEQEDAEREKGKTKFRELLESLELEPYARWRQTQDRFMAKIREDGRQDDLAVMHEIDYLLVFEDYVKELEKKFNDVRQKERDTKYRRERKNREAFNVLLSNPASN